MKDSDLLDGGLLSKVQLLVLLGDPNEMTFWRWRRQHGLPEPAVVIGRRQLWRRDEVERWLSEHRTAPALAAHLQDPAVVARRTATCAARRAKGKPKSRRPPP